MKIQDRAHRRPALALLVSVLVVLVGLGASAALAESGLRTRPFRVTQEADFVTVGTCAFGAPLQVIAGTGHATHLGRFESYGETCLSSPTNLITWTAANGDSITIEYTTEVGPVGPDGSASISFSAVATSGTGRFERVTLGEGDPLAGTVWFAPDGLSGHLEVSLDGTIAYAASDRSGG